MKKQILMISLSLFYIIFPNTNSAQGLINQGSNIVLTNGSNIILEGTSGNYTCNNGGLISNFTTGGKISVKGNWINNSTGSGFQNNGTLVLFNGATQEISGTDTMTFFNFNIQNSSLTLSVPHFKVTNNLSFNKGIIYSASNHTIEFANSSTVIGASDSGYVNGPVLKTGSEIFVFPIGKSGLYRPLEISAPSQVTDRFVGEYFTQDPNQYYDVTNHDPSIDHVSRCEFWTLNRTAGTSSISVTLSWNSVNCGVAVPADLEVGYWDNALSIWKDHGNGGTTGNANAGTVVSLAPMSSFGAFAIVSTSSANPLPVELISFNAIANGDHVDLLWSTATEINSDYFTLERTINNLDFEKVKDVKGSGNTTITTNYSFADELPYQGISYYRLKQTDFDGKIFTSDLKKVEFNSNTQQSTQVFPNPATTDNIQMKIDGMEGQILMITISDDMGRLIHSGFIYPDTQHQIYQLSGSCEGYLPAGIYSISVSGNNYLKNCLVVVK